MVLSLFGNLLVCYAVYRNPRLRCPSNYYIISLALSDIFQALCTMPLSIGLLATSDWPFGTSACYFLAISKLSLTKISIYTMALMALGRYYKIVKPATYQSTFKRKFIIATGLLAWVVPILDSIFAAFVFDFDASLQPGLAICKIEITKFYFAILIVFEYTPFFVILTCYWKIYKTVKMHNANISWKNSNVEEVNITKTLFTTGISFVSLWVPYRITFHLSYALADKFNFPRIISLIGTLLLFISSCVNPFIYGFMNRAFRNEFKKCLIPRRTNSIGTGSS